MLPKIWVRLVRSYASFPSLRQWGESVLLLAMFVLFALPVGLSGGLLTFKHSSDSIWQILFFAAVIFVSPSLVEETIFRALMLPHSKEKKSPRWLMINTVIAVTLFILWHPLGGWLFLPWARSLFCEPIFLILCGLFGLMTSVAYLRTGSIWPCVLMHWLVVFVWKTWLGGFLAVVGPPV